VYLGDDEPYNIVGKGNVTVSLSNGFMLKFKDVRHVQKLKRNMIYVSQLAGTRMKTTFNSDLCKITKGVMITAHGKKESTFYLTLGSMASISIASSDIDAGT